MRAAIYTTKGPATDVLKIVELPDPQPAAGEVRVRIAFSGVNPSDVKSRSGTASRGSSYPQVIPHSDGAGVIDLTGPGVSADLLGRRVWVFNAQWDRAFGTAAGYVTLPVSQVVPLPDAVSFEVGASIAIPLMTAMHAVQACGTLLGKTVLIPGAAGSVGFYATQLAAMAGARVIGVVSSDEKAALALAAGAADIINYRNESLVERVQALTAGRGADCIIEVDAAAHAALYGSLLCFDGKAVIYGSGNPQITLPFGPMIVGFVTMVFFIVYRLPPAALKAVLDGVSAALARPGFQHPPTAIYPLEQIAAAHEQVERGANAKVLIRL
jgi:NADPH2:quinone reductase